MIFHASPGFLEIVKSFHEIDKARLISEQEEKFDKKINGENYELVKKLINNYHAFYFDESETVQNFVPKSSEEFEKLISNISQICLEVTQSCNLRCTYCIYSGNYKYFRVHARKNMNYEVAKKSLDYFFSLINSPKRSKKIGIIYIGFFGGEPLLAFDLIKNCVEYVNLKKAFIKDKIFFAITTNGLLLKDEIARFIVENDFLVAISLDGPQEEHDKNRISKGGEGSFGVVWNNIKRLKEYNEKYFETNVIFELTLSTNHNLTRVDTFFNELIGNRNERLKVSFVREERPSLEFKNEFENLKTNYYNKICMKQPLTPLMDSLFSLVYKSFAEKTFTGNTHRIRYTSSCSLDTFRLFVSADGKFHICERINPFFPIGSYKTGIQFEKVKMIFKKYSAVLKNCKYCVAKHFCFLCYAYAAQGKEFKLEKVCEDIKIDLKERLTEYVSILEENPEAFTSYKWEKENDIFEEIFY